MMRDSTRRTRIGEVARWGAAACLLAGACAHDWDAYDPRLSGGAGGHGGGTAGGGQGGIGQGGAGGVAPPPGEHLCSQRFGDVDVQSARGIATGPTGDVVVTGYFLGAVNFGGGQLSSAGESDIFIAKFDSQCNHLFSIGFGGLQFDNGWSAAVDGSGDIAVVGAFEDSVNFGGTLLTSAGGSDVFVSKLSSSGDFLWTIQAGDVASQYGNRIAFDPSGNVIAMGTFSGVMNFGGADLSPVGDEDIFAAKLDPQGNHVWSRAIGGIGWESVRGFAVDPFGNVLITGGFSGSMDLDGNVLAAAGERDTFVTKLDQNGNVLWAREFDCPGALDEDYGRSAGADATGNVVIAGRFEGSIDLGEGPLQSAGGRDIFVAKLDPDGALLWGARYGGPADDNLRDIAVDPGGEVTLAGNFGSTIDFGGGVLTTSGNTDAFIVRLDASGGHLWSRQFGDAGDQTGTAVARSASGPVVVAGDFTGVIDLGGEALASAGSEDVFLVMLTP